MVGARAERVGPWRSLRACPNSHSGRVRSLHARSELLSPSLACTQWPPRPPGGFPELARLLLATLGSALAEALETYLSSSQALM